MRSLVNKLVKRMLSVSSGLSPHDWPCVVRNCFPVSVHAFPVTLHITLLEISRKTMHILIVRKNSFGFSIKKISVPDPNYCHNNGDVPTHIGSPEMFVHRFCTFEQVFEIFITDCQCYG